MSAAHSPRVVEAARTEWSRVVRPLERGPVISLIRPRGKSRCGVERRSGGAAKRHPAGSGANILFSPFVRHFSVSRGGPIDNRPQVGNLPHFELGSFFGYFGYS